jgi:hypothetical protein
MLTVSSLQLAASDDNRRKRKEMSRLTKAALRASRRATAYARLAAKAEHAGNYKQADWYRKLESRLRAEVSD